MWPRTGPAMPLQRRTTKRKFHQWAEEDMQKPLTAVQNGAKKRETCRNYNIPWGTFHDRLTGRVNPEKPKRMGPDPFLSLEFEQQIVTWLINISNCGFPIKKQELLTTVQKIVRDKNIKTPFKGDRPGQKWYESFMRRHPELSPRAAESIDSSRANVTEEFIRKWFRDLEEFLDSINARDVLTDPNRMFNGDESGFSLCPKTGTVIAPRGYKNVYEVKRGSEKDNITVLVTFSAAGKLCPPCIVYPYVKPPRAIADSMPETWILGKSESGWMRSDVFYEYVANGMHQWIVDQDIPKPVIFFVDGHRSHMSLELSTFCDENGIILYALPPNSTHLMQPADVAVFKPLKNYWRDAVRQWQHEHVGKSVTKVTFAPLFELIMANEKISQHMIKGFERCGLFPFNPDAVDYSKCVRNTLEKVASQQINAQPAELSPTDFASARRVLDSLKTNLLNRAQDVDWIIDELQIFENRVLGNQDSPPRSPPIENQTQEELVEDFLVDHNGFLSLQEYPMKDSEDNENLENSFRQEDNPSKVHILRIDIFPPPENEPNIALETNKVLPVLQDDPTNPNKDLLSSSSREAEVIPEKITVNNDGRTLEEEINVAINETANGDSKTATDEIQSVMENETQMNNTNTNGRESLIDCPRAETSATSLFDKHLTYPKPAETRKRARSGPSTSAISASAWRDYYVQKEREKDAQIEMKKRKKEEAQKKKLEKSTNKKPRTSLKTKQTTKKEKCAACEDDLHSDAEDGLKNLGCDLCPRWYHLDCTAMAGQNFEEVAGNEFTCDICCAEENSNDISA